MTLRSNYQSSDIYNFEDDTVDQLPTDIPTDPDEFYPDFGLLEYPLTRDPVQHLTAYQYAVWKDGQRHRYREVIKSQKVGITISSLIEDFQKAITTCRGKEILVIAQGTEHAKDHLYTLRKLISNVTGLMEMTVHYYVCTEWIPLTTILSRFRI